MIPNSERFYLKDNMVQVQQQVRKKIHSKASIFRLSRMIRDRDQGSCDRMISYGLPKAVIVAENGTDTRVHVELHFSTALFF